MPPSHVVEVPHKATRIARIESTAENRLIGNNFQPLKLQALELQKPSFR